ncbi:hypothetical protein [Actibacterium pelagium]|uniref:Porin n=1 Tax=Actibacterium pelagium TaxID=2029103 RepID=A0A917AFF6_9RHOB|nr:hypothetical protein [Actibacterium pelagium]GGE48376.1 hypothetical protein GCM10011517_15280 [Actibacterium pelagium]
MNKLGFVAAAALAVSVSTAAAEVSFEFGVDFVSDYVFEGYLQTDGGAPQIATRA